MESGGSPVYACLSPENDVQRLEINNSLEDVTLTELEELLEDFRDPDYVPNSNSSCDSDDTADFIPVGTVCPNAWSDAASSCISSLAKRPTETNIAASESPSEPSDRTTNEKIKKTKLNKRHVCLFCNTSQTKLKRHLLSKHMDEPGMFKFLSATGKEKSKELEKLRNAGDHLHNVESLKKGDFRALITKRKLNRQEVGNDDFVPCTDCLGYFLKRDLWRHKCPVTKDSIGKMPKKQMVRQGRMILPRAEDGDSCMEIFDSLRRDQIAIAVKNDSLIKLLCKREFVKNGHDRDRHSHIRNKLREMGRLLIEMRKITNMPEASLGDFIKPQHFQNILSATKAVAGYTDFGHEYGKPSLAMKIGHNLRRCSILLKAQAIEQNENSVKEDCEAFDELCRIRWEEEISANAYRTLSQNKKNNTNEMPLLEDVRKLTNYLKKDAEVLCNRLKSTEVPNKDFVWARLAEKVLCQIILFNRRRQGEASKMTVAEYSKGVNNSTHNPDVLNGLSELEKALCKIFTRIEIVGKRGRTVPVILTTEMKSSVDLLIEFRERVGVNPENVFVFARPNCDSLSHIRGSDCLRQETQSTGVDLEKPELLRSTSLRKQLATMTQLINLQDNELDMVAQYMGHDVRIHRTYYRLPTATVQVAKVSKLLIAMSNGNTDVVGANVADDADQSSGSDFETDAAVLTAGDKNSLETVESGQDYSPPRTPSSQRTSKQKKDRGRDMHNRQPWSDMEQAAVMKSLGKYVYLGTLPGKATIEKAKTEDDALAGRTWIQIKNFIRNKVVARQKKS